MDLRISMFKTKQNLRRLIVPSGHDFIGKKQGAIVHADLGTCVGVALWDQHAEVGGLIHLLLPEPPGEGDPWQPGIYAKTGLPLFIERLCREGASMANLEASYAGGALMGQVSRVDLNLDIGGRTADIVESILNKDKIRIRECEIGGYFSCRLSLNLQTWETEIEPLGLPTASGDSAGPGKAGILDIADAMKQLRPIPQIALKVLRMLSDQTYRHDEVVKEIMQDQVMSAKIIGFCNSAFFGIKTQVDSIERALFIVGEKWLLQLILTAAVEEFLSQTDEGYSLCKGGLFRHACGTAAVAKSLALFAGKVPPDLAYTAGLLHDIGKVVLDQFMHAKRPLFYRYIQAGRVDLIDAEKEFFGATHPEAGKQLAMSWSIPESLGDAIAHHHQPENAAVEPDLTLLVYFADLIMSRFMVGQEMEKLSIDALGPRLSRIGISPEQLPLLIARLPLALKDSEWMIQSLLG
jgi:putative nucleotidyltransferase with HDIG domain